MRYFNTQWIKPGVAKSMHQAAAKGAFDLQHHDLGGPANMTYLESCRAHHSATGTRLIFTRDSGHHSSGWWKNPDYERCLHLSLSFIDPDKLTETHIAHRHDLAGEWIEAFFPTTQHLVWTEPPYGPEGRRADVWHYRVFYSAAWASTILPRGEVYSKEFTDRHWLSWSDRAAALANEPQDTPPT